MKSISASIVVLAGAVLIAVGAIVRHSDTSMVVSGIGCLIGLMGLLVWAACLRAER